MAFFPASGVLRDVSLSFIVTAIFLTVEFLVLLLYQWLKSPRQLDDIRFVWSIFMVALIAQLFSYIMSDFYALSWEREFWIKLGYISTISGITVFTFVAERKLLRTRFFFTCIGPAGVILTLLLPHSILKYFSYTIFYPIYSVFFVMLFYRLREKIENPLRKQVNLFTLGFLSFLGGYSLTADIVVQLSGGLSYLFGSFLMTVSIIAVNFSVLKMPSFGELDWDTKIKEIYLISNTGAPLLYIDFESGVSTIGPDQALTAAVISALSLGLKSTGKNRKVKVVDQGDVKFLFGYANNATLVLAVTEDLQIIRRKIDEFVESFNMLFDEVFETWDGNINVFKPAEALAVSIFTKSKY